MVAALSLSPPTARPLRVGVLVDLAWSKQAGGHVKCWERLSRAATELGGALDLTIHFSGAASARQELADNVRYIIEPPVFSTASLRFLAHVPDHTDLAPWHPRLARALGHYDVIHTTDAYFAYARTALRFAGARGVPLVNSVHTNTPEYTRLYTGLTIERLVGKGAIARLLHGRLDVAGRAEARMRRRLLAHQMRCRFVLVSRRDELAACGSAMPGRVGLLRRGIDRNFFHPDQRDRAWLQQRFGIGREEIVLLFAGRIDSGKNVGLLVEAARALQAQGAPVHLFCAGEGSERAAIRASLGERASCPGNLAPEELAPLYASADIFAFPSAIEEFANVVPEALASGLPVLLCDSSAMAGCIRGAGAGFALPVQAPQAWREVIAMLAACPERRAHVARAARHLAEAELPSWREVLEQDLMPRWRDAADGQARD
jgi:glycosyltransferase involved in cell wall biosynthesis